MTYQIPWARVIAEGIAIIVSILLAFAGQAWWESRSEQVERLAYLNRMHDELSLGLPEITGLYTQCVEALAAMDSLLALEEAPDRPPVAELAALVRRAGQYEFNERSVTLDQTYQEMLATGSFALLEDQSLRQAITGYYRGIGRLTANLAVSDAQGFRSLATEVRGATGRGPVEDRPFTDREVDRLASLLPANEAEWSALRFTRSRLAVLLIALQSSLRDTAFLIDELATQMGQS